MANDTLGVVGRDLAVQRELHRVTYLAWGTNPLQREAGQLL